MAVYIWIIVIDVDLFQVPKLFISSCRAVIRRIIDYVDIGLIVPANLGHVYYLLLFGCDLRRVKVNLEELKVSSDDMLLYVIENIWLLLLLLVLLLLHVPLHLGVGSGWYWWLWVRVLTVSLHCAFLSPLHLAVPVESTGELLSLGLLLLWSLGWYVLLSQRLLLCG
jgi:hypothetical protein